ncbi:MAG: arginine deiminase-related protein [Desulfuromusa sp.]|nr:arginine deiminase-related protein [Desulfuromusa sp.]
MPAKSIQAPGSVVVIRPHRFLSNPETALDNAFQKADGNRTAKQTAEDAHREVSEAAERLEKEGVRVHIFEDRGENKTPDSVFPNNWFSTHPGGHIAIYPMYAPSRRRERRYDILEMLKAEYRVQDIIDYSCLEYDDIFLEGTGAMVLDQIDRVAYTARSNRADAIALERFCTHFNFEPMAFDAVDSQGHSVYHTNVIMCIGTDFAMAGFEMMTDKLRRNEIYARLQGMGRDVIELTTQQIDEFAGNAIELYAKDRRILAISTRAAASLRPEQKKIIERSADIIPLSVPTIELAGGSIRCMLAGIHLSKR